VTPDGRIDTLGGIGQEGYSGDGGPARLAAFGAPHGLDALADGTVIVADSHNGVIRRIDGATRIVTTIARGFSAPVGVDARPDGSIYVADARLDHIVRIAPDGEPDAARPSAATAELGRRRPRRQVRLRKRVPRPPHQQDRLADGTGLGARQALTTMLPTTLSCSAWFFLSQSGQR
jgi:hypothetical protein